MRYNVVSTPQAQIQLIEIIVYLEKAEAGLGLAFRQQAKEVEKYLGEFPEMCPTFEHTNPMLGEVRMIRLKKFKHHTFFFRVTKHPEKVVDIIAILHDEQDIYTKLDTLPES